MGVGSWQVSRVVVVGAAVTLSHGGGGALPLDPVKATHRPAPTAVRRAIFAHGPPRFPLPEDFRLDAYAPLSNGRVFVFAVYHSHGQRCELGYEAHAVSLAPTGREGAGVALNCRPIRSLSASLNLGVAGLAGPLVLYGSAPLAADRLRIRTDRGDTLTYALPHVPIRTDVAREAVILDLTGLGQGSVRRTWLLHGDRVLQQGSYYP